MITLPNSDVLSNIAYSKDENRSFCPFCLWRTWPVHLAYIRNQSSAAIRFSFINVMICILNDYLFEVWTSILMFQYSHVITYALSCQRVPFLNHALLSVENTWKLAMIVQVSVIYMLSASLISYLLMIINSFFFNQMWNYPFSKDESLLEIAWLSWTVTVSWGVSARLVNYVMRQLQVSNEGVGLSYSVHNSRCWRQGLQVSYIGGEIFCLFFTVIMVATSPLDSHVFQNHSLFFFLIYCIDTRVYSALSVSERTSSSVIPTTSCGASK